MDNHDDNYNDIIVFIKDECPICYDQINDLFITHCNHHFCNSCIHKWAKTKNSCPLCRSLLNFMTIYENIPEEKNEPFDPFDPFDENSELYMDNFIYITELNSNILRMMSGMAGLSYSN